MGKNRLDIIWQDAEDVLKSVDFNWLEGKTVIVTGATGLLGTHFLATLALLNRRNAKMRVFGVCHSNPADYTIEIAEQGKLNLVDQWHHDSDVVIHAAGFAQPVKFTSNPAETIRINTTWTQQLLERLRPNGKFLFTSSSEVYNGCFLPVDRAAKEENIGTTTPYHPRACYIEGKRCGEAIANAYRQSGVDAKSVRLGLTYGPGCRKDDKRAMSTFIQQALTYNRIKMEYSGLERRSFCYVKDAVETMWNVLLRGTQPVYNVGGISAYRIRAVASAIASITYADYIEFPGGFELPGSSGGIMNISLAQREFDKKSYVSMEDGLKRTIEWHRGL